jgi:CheY-like chemotaxis protein
MKILIVEDDPDDRAWIRRVLDEHFEVDRFEEIDGESKFNERFEALAQAPPELVILDLMLKWKSVALLSDEERGTSPGNFAEAGFRCHQRLRNDPRTSRVPVLLWTVVDTRPAQLPSDAVFVHKTHDASCLLRVVRSMVIASGREIKNKERSQGLIFVSYSHHDKKWFDEICVSLSPFIRNEEIQSWDDKMVVPGKKWREEIQHRLESATVALFLVSRYFFASEYINRVELPQLLENAQKRGTRIAWVAVSASPYRRSPLGAFQALNSPTAPLDSLSASDLNRDLVQIAERVYDLFRQA